MPVKPTSDSVVPPSVSNMSSLGDPSSGPSSLLTTSNQISALGHEDSSPSSLAPQHNKYDKALWHFFVLMMTAGVLIVLFIAFQLSTNTAEQFDAFFSSHFKHKSTGDFF